MAALGEKVFARLTTFAQTQALIGNRCYPDALPQEPNLPAVVYEELPGDTSNGNGLIVTSRVRVTSWAETGGECGQGGFNWAGFSADEFRAWCAFYLKVQQQPLVIAGKTYPSPFLAATLFQWGNVYDGPGGWLGYALDNYIGVLQTAWAGQLPAEKALGMDDEIALYAGELPPADYVPPAKQMSQIME
jgi:hypothetical protein